MKIESDSILVSRKLQICPKVTKMGSTIGHRIVIIGVGALRCQRHIPSKNPLPQPFGGVIAVSWFFRSRALAMCSKQNSLPIKRTAFREQKKKTEHMRQKNNSVNRNSSIWPFGAKSSWERGTAWLRNICIIVYFLIFREIGKAIFSRETRRTKDERGWISPEWFGCFSLSNGIRTKVSLN